MLVPDGLVVAGDRIDHQGGRFAKILCSYGGRLNAIPQHGLAPTLRESKEKEEYLDTYAISEKNRATS